MNERTAPEAIHVAVAVVVDDDGRIVIARRPDHLHQGGCWEFPGGKVDSGETVRDAVTRELDEELGIRPRDMRPLLRVPYRYPDRNVLLDVWRVDGFLGTPRGREGQPVRRVRPEHLDQYTFPPANRPIVMAARLAPAYLITPADEGDPQRLLDGLSRALAAGDRLFLWRTPALAGDSLETALAEAERRVHAVPGARLMCHDGSAPRGVDAGDGLHASARTLMKLGERPVPADRLFAASCHDARELARAAELGVDFAVLSPVRETASHPGLPGRGWQWFEETVRDAPFPVYALGGVGRSDLARAWSVRAQGVAGIRGLWPVSE